MYPLVSVIIATYNRPKILHEALDSIYRQTYSNFEIILVRDGGSPVYNIPENTSLFYGNYGGAIKFIDRNQNKGLAYSYNEALRVAKGKYICYIGDDDKYYPNHIETLVNVAEGDNEYGAWYTDLYKVYYWPNGDEREVISKEIEVCRDFDRNVMLNYNHVLGMSLMHRRDLLSKTGLYNEEVKVLLDWDITRKLCFYCDFKHIPITTGEYYASVEGSDRLSVRKIKDPTAALFNILTIRNTRPAKPWDKCEDLAIIIMADKYDKRLEHLINNIWSHSYYPYRIYLPMPQEELNKVVTFNNSVVCVPTSKLFPVVSGAVRLQMVLDISDADYFCLLEKDHRIAADAVAWVERGLSSAMLHKDKMFQVGVTGRVVSRDYFGKYLSDDEELDLTLYEPPREEWPFAMDDILNQITKIEGETNPDWNTIVMLSSYLEDKYGNESWLRRMRANALLKSGRFGEALDLAMQNNAQRETVEGLLVQARAEKSMKMDDTETMARVKELLE